MLLQLYLYYLYYLFKSPKQLKCKLKESVEKILNGPRVSATKNEDGSVTIEHINKGE